VLCPATDGDVAKETIKQLRSMTRHAFYAITGVDKKHEGFTKNANSLLESMKMWFPETEYVVIINQDIRTQDGWLERLIEAMDSSPQYGMASPSGNCRTQPICYGKPGMEKKVQWVRQLPMFSTIIRRKMIDEIGLLHNGYIHYGSDSDYCERARQAGWYCVWVQDIYVENQLSPEIEEWKKHDRDLFKQRWGW